MNMRLTIKSYLCLALVLHVAAVAVAIYSVNAAGAYWQNFVEGPAFPRLLQFVVASAPWLPWLSVAVVLAGILVAFRASESIALHCLAGVVALTVGILCVTAVGLSKPMWIAAHIMEQKSANKVSEPSGAAAPQVQH